MKLFPWPMGEDPVCPACGNHLAVDYSWDYPPFDGSIASYVCLFKTCPAPAKYTTIQILSNPSSFLPKDHVDKIKA